MSVKKCLSQIFSIAVSAGISIQVYGQLSAKSEVNNYIAISLATLAFGMLYKIYAKWFSQPARKRNSVKLIDDARLLKQPCDKI